MSRRITWFGGSRSSGAYQPETIAFLNAVGIADDGNITIYGITGNAVWQGVDAFIVTGKAAGWWSKQLALYPFIGGSAVTHRVNMVNPSTYLGTFFGGMTHDANGITGNGTNAYMATGLIPSALGAGYLDDFGFGLYNRSNFGSNTRDVGLVDTLSAPTAATELITKQITALQASRINAGSPTTNPNTAQAVVPKQVGVNRINSSEYRKINDNAAVQVLAQVSIRLPGVELLVLGFNLNGALIGYSPRNLAAFRVHRGLSDAEESSLQTATEALQVTLNRNVTW